MINTIKNKAQNLCCLLLAIVFDALNISVVYNKENPLSEEEVANLIKTFQKKLINKEIEFDG